MADITLKPGATERLPLEFWADGPPEALLALDSVAIWASDLPVPVSILPPDAPPVAGARHGTLFIDASGPERAQLESGKLYSIEIKTVASLDHTIWPAIIVEVPR